MEVGLAVGGALLSSALNVFFDRMTPKFPNLFQGPKGDYKLLKKLKKTLSLLEIVLEDAEAKRNTDNHVKKWLRELKDAVYHAEDLMDEINTEALRLEYEEAEGSVINTVSHLSDEFLIDITPKIEEIVSTLEDFAAQINVLGLGRGVTNKENSCRLPSTSLIDESGVYGRDNESEKLINMVLSDDANGNNVSIIPIVGMGGVGKTTLAQLVYGDKRVIEHFQKQAWVCVSENYDAFKITKTLVGGVAQLGSEERDDLNRLQVKLKESLVEKKFLIVLDDVWNENYTDWDKLTVPLKYGKQGSKIILTTRIEKIALMVRSELPIHYLNPISDEDCWLLFKKHAFDNGGLVASPEFEKIGKEIVKKCKGLPLAVMALGGLLRSKTEVKEWDDISTSQFWNSENNPNDVLPVLRLSYHHLPPHIKQCFAFCALFPKNHDLKEKELVLLWMANDLLQHPSRTDKTIEDVGYEFINELRSRSLFRKACDGTYVMHDLVNDLARYVSESFCFRYEHYHHHGEIPSEARHFSHINDSLSASEIFKIRVQVKSLRTLYPGKSGGSTDIFLSNIVPGLKFLRVLCLSGYRIKEVPDTIFNLKHLRYIDLSSSSITQIPDAICNMHNLQTLKLCWCTHLHELPKNFSKLVNLRHLELTGAGLREMPIHIGRLKSLQTLRFFIIGKSPGRGIEELEKLDLHGFLMIKELQKVISCNDTVKANLRNKKHLEHLVLEWSGDTDISQIEMDIFERLQPSTFLKRLSINGYGGTRFSDWLADDSYCSIVSLSLKNCKYCLSLPALGNLPSLKFLVIKRLDSITKVGQEFYGDASLTKPFQSLVSLKIKHMMEWEEWDTPGNVDFSLLEKLNIRNCPKLIGKLPPKILQLTKLKIWDCPRFVFPDHWKSMPNPNVLPESLIRLRGLQRLDVDGCHSLVSFPRIQNLTFLHRIEIWNCHNLLSFPSGGLSVPNLKRLTICECRKLKALPEQMQSLNPSLRDLHISGCVEIESFPEGVLPLSLECLEIDFCQKLVMCRSSWGLQKLPALRRFSMSSHEYEDSFGDEWLLPDSLKSLSLSRLEHLKTLDQMGVHRLTSLENLTISDCPELLSFPAVGLPATLSELSVEKCPLLTPHLEREKGKFWPNISHIAHIDVDYKTVRIKSISCGRGTR